MSKRLLDHDPVTGISTYHDYDHASDTTFIETTQDAQGILDYTKRLANDSSYKQQGIKNDSYHFATIPMTVVMELKQKYGLDIWQEDDLPKIEQVISRDYKYLLTVNRI